MAALITGVSTVIGMVGKAQEGAAAEAQGEYNAQLAERDIGIVDEDRKITANQTLADTQDLQRSHSRDRSAMRASFGTSGLDFSGSILDVLADTSSEQALDVERVRFEGHMQNRNSALKQLGLKEEANISRMQGQQRKAASGTAALGVGLAGAGRIAQQGGF